MRNLDDAPGLIVRPVRNEAEAQTACDIMVEAAQWLADTGRALWSIGELTPEKILSGAGKTLYLAQLNDEPAGTFLLQQEDPQLWPESVPGEALYLHKLAVRRTQASTGLSRTLLKFATEETRKSGRPFLRLDCAPRPKLKAIYETAGFQFHSEIQIFGFDACRYEMRV